MKKFFKDQRGAFLIVEAAIIYPIMLVMIMSLLFISMMLAMKANMQSALEISLMYYRNELTDTYTVFIDDLGKNNAADTNFTKLNEPRGWSNIYVNAVSEIFDKPDNEKFKKMFFNNYKFLNFSSGERGGTFNSTGIEVNIESGGNFIIYRELKATAEQTITLPFINGIFGIDNKFVISSSAKIIVSDGVSVMRITDVVDYAMHKTGADTKLEEFADKYVQKFLKLLGG